MVHSPTFPVVRYLSTVIIIRQTNNGCIIEDGLLTKVQTHAMETLGPINLAVLSEIKEKGILTRSRELMCST